ncbi:MAG: hypothetical protein JJ863_00845 [Deltaproteobacteria bacterium]|nr:hypothetical protein [Deltaproteobacteria bacterium]
MSDAPDRPSPQPSPRKRRRKRAMRWVRKTHMYLGLFLFPWVIFFGVSGMLFNHPNIGQEGVHARPIPAELLREQTGVGPIDPDEVAAEVVEALGERGLDYELDEDFESRFHGSTAFATNGADETHLVLLDLEAGRGLLLSRPAESAEPPAFAGTLELPERQLAALEPKLAGLMPALEVETDGPPRRHPRIAPTLRFRMTDAGGTRWNVTYHLGSGQLDGRPTDESPDLSLHDLLGAMHKTHHFPPRLGPTTFWALFADLTGIVLVIWALTGLLMWVQIKKARVVGTVVVSVGLLVSAWTMLATHEELRFPNVRPEGPGGPPPPSAPAEEAPESEDAPAVETDGAEETGAPETEADSETEEPEASAPERAPME